MIHSYDSLRRSVSNMAYAASFMIAQVYLGILQRGLTGVHLDISGNSLSLSFNIFIHWILKNYKRQPL